MKIRMRDTGDIIVDDEFRARHGNTSFPSTLTAEILDSFDADEVHETAQPPVTEGQYVAFVGAEQRDGLWYTVYEARDYTPEQLAERLEQKRQKMVVTPFQAKAALFSAGLLDDVETLVAAAETSTLTKLAWANAIEWRRTSPMLAELASALNITDTQLDDLFIAAAAIVA